MSDNIHLSRKSFEQAILNAIAIGRSEQTLVVLEMLTKAIDKASENQLDGSFIAGLVCAKEIINLECKK